jgi:hypothetical protein
MSAAKRAPKKANDEPRLESEQNHSFEIARIIELFPKTVEASGRVSAVFITAFAIRAVNKPRGYVLIGATALAGWLTVAINVLVRASP